MLEERAWVHDTSYCEFKFEFLWFIYVFSSIYLEATKYNSTFKAGFTQTRLLSLFFSLSISKEGDFTASLSNLFLFTSFCVISLPSPPRPIPHQDFSWSTLGPLRFPLSLCTSEKILTLSSLMKQMNTVMYHSVSQRCHVAFIRQTKWSESILEMQSCYVPRLCEFYLTDCTCARTAYTDARKETCVWQQYCKPTLMRSGEMHENLQAEREVECTVPHQPWNKIGMAPFTKIDESISLCRLLLRLVTARWFVRRDHCKGAFHWTWHMK